MLVGLVWAAAVLLSAWVLWTTGRSVWRSARRLTASLGELGDRAAAVATALDGLRPGDRPAGDAGRTAPAVRTMSGRKRPVRRRGR